MITVNKVAQIMAALWIASEALITLLRRPKPKTRDSHQSDSFIMWTINILSITAGINIAARSGSNGIGSFSPGYSVAGWLGLILIITGMAVRWNAILTLGRQFTTSLTIVEDHKIIDYGIYKYIRHPSYTGALLSFLGLSLTLSNWMAVIVIFVPILMGYIYRINIEEKILLKQFGGQYVSYASKTSRLIPKIY